MRDFHRLVPPSEPVGESTTLDRVFLRTLMRPPTGSERRYLGFLPRSVVGWGLRWSAEHRHGVVPFLNDAFAVLGTIEDGRVELDDVWQLHDRWRRNLVDLHPRWSARDLPDRNTVDGHRAHVATLFEQVLERPPDAPTSRSFVARVCLGLDDFESLRSELARSAEGVRLQAFRHAAEETLRTVDAVVGSSPHRGSTEDVRCLVERWRAVAECSGDPSPIRSDADDLDPRDRVRAVDDMFRSILLRPPDARTRRLVLARWGLGLDDLGTLRAEVMRCVEHTEIVLPLVKMIHDLHRELTHRPPTIEEVQACVDRVRTDLRTHDALVAGLADGTVRRKLGIRPLKLEMDVTSQCNLRCTMCYLSDPRFGHRERVDVSVEEFRSIARQVFPFCGLVSLSFGTEPLLHPRITELLEITAREEVPWIYLITNAQLLDERMIEAFVRVPLHGFSVSVDAATPGTYERIRRGGKWDRLVSNVRALQAAKKRAGSEYPRVTFNFVLMRSNVHELPGLVRLAHELGVEGVSAMHVTPFDGLDVEGEQLHADAERCNALLAEARSEAERLGVPIALPEPFDLEPHRARVLKPTTPEGFLFPEPTRLSSPCPFPWQFVGVDPYGKVVPCGWWYTRPPMGDLRTQTFADIWNGSKWRELRREHTTGELQSSCRSCPAAGMGSCDNPGAFSSVKLGATPPRRIRDEHRPSRIVHDVDRDSRDEDDGTAERPDSSDGDVKRDTA